jgi:uncharacterized RDD family membrane protein YckC
MSIIQIATPFNIDLEFEIAEFHKRLLAYIIDFTLLIIYMYSMKYLLYTLFMLDESNIGIDIIVVSLPMLLYSLFTELWMDGQTVGKRIMKIRVISLDGGEPTFGQFLIRWIVRFWEWPFFFGYIALSGYNLLYYIFATGFFGVVVVIVIAINSKSQRLGDIAAGTVVVNTQTDLSLTDTIFQQVNNMEYKVAFPDVMRLSDRDINTIKNVVTMAEKKGNYDMCNRVALKIKDVLKIKTDLDSPDFLNKLLEDYNYLATKE